VGSVDPEFKNQIHDYNPGIAPNGLFWTMPFPDDWAWVDLSSGTAEMHARTLDIPDAYNVINAISGGPSEPAKVSFDVWWHTPTATEQLRDETVGFAATLLEVTSALSFSAENADFAFVSDPPETSVSLYARVGYEANGVFLPPVGPLPAVTPTS
jgi:hypothetical protein